MAFLPFFIGVFLSSVFGVIIIFIIRYFRLRREESLALKLAIQNSEKEKLEEKKEQLEKAKIGKKRRKETVRIIEEKKVEIKKNVSTKDLSVLIAKSDFHISRKEFSDAEKILIEVLSFDNDHISALEKLGYIYIETENYSKAKLLYERLIEKFPRNPNVYTNFAVALFYEREFEKSIESYEKAKELDPENPIRYINLGKLFFAVKNYPNAIEYFTLALKISPRNVEYNFLLADTYKITKRFAEAKKWYEKILELSPYDLDAKKEIEKLDALGF